MLQREIFPLDIVRMDPCNLGTADLKCIAVAADSHTYAVKRLEDHPALPGSEWFCYELANACGIPTPPNKVLRLPDGVLAFGSRWEAASFDTSIINHWAMVLSKEICVTNFGALLSSIYAFDLFVANDDRHAGNILLRPSRPPDYSMLAYDFSRALFIRGWPPSHLPDECNTYRLQKTFLGCGVIFDTDAAYKVLDRLTDIKGSEIELILEKTPDSWMTHPTKQQMLEWWNSDARMLRLSLIRGGLNDESLL